MRPRARRTATVTACTCTPHPYGDGPERDCPVHGELDDGPDPRDEHDAWHPVWVEGCDGCVDRADELERSERVPDLHVLLDPAPEVTQREACGACTPDGDGPCLADCRKRAGQRLVRVFRE
jgi:hypothetical protein